MRQLILVIGLLLSLTGTIYAQEQSSSSGSPGITKGRKRILLKPDTLHRHIAYADISIIRLSYAGLVKARQQYRTERAKLGKSSNGNERVKLKMNKADSLRINRERAKESQPLYSSIIMVQERKMMAIVNQVAKEKKYERVSFQQADKQAGMEDITLDIIQRLR